MKDVRQVKMKETITSHLLRIKIITQLFPDTIMILEQLVGLIIKRSIDLKIKANYL
jgi:hypothetical protein